MEDLLGNAAAISVMLEKIVIIKSEPKETAKTSEDESVPSRDQDIKE